MIRRAVLVGAVAALVACGGASPSISTPAAVDPSPASAAVDRANAVIEELVSARYDAVYARFDDRVRAGISVDRLKQVWESGPGRAGAFRAVSRIRPTTTAGLDQVTLTLDFERAVYDVQITFRPDGSIAGLFVRPGIAGSAAGPPADITGSALVHAAAILASLALVAALWIGLHRRFATGPRLYFFGAVIFVASQVGHLPFNALVLQPVLSRGGDLIASAAALGLSAGLFEEIARYLAFRFWLRRDRGWVEAVGLGAGHGGIEAVLLALLAGVALAVAVLGRALPDAPAVLVDQSTLYWSRPAGLAVALPVERLSALALHLVLAVLVMRSVERGDVRYLLAAIGWHAVVDASVYYLLVTAGAVVAEAVAALFGSVSIALVIVTRPRRSRPVARADATES